MPQTLYTHDGGKIMRAKRNPNPQHLDKIAFQEKMKTKYALQKKLLETKPISKPKFKTLKEVLDGVEKKRFHGKQTTHKGFLPQYACKNCTKIFYKTELNLKRTWNWRCSCGRYLVKDYEPTEFLVLQ